MSQEGNYVSMGKIAEEEKKEILWSLHSLFEHKSKEESQQRTHGTTLGKGNTFGRNKPSISERENCLLILIPSVLWEMHC